MYSRQRAFLSAVFLLLAGCALTCGPSITSTVAPTAIPRTPLTPVISPTRPPTATAIRVPPSPTPVSHPGWATYTTADGLAHNGVSVITVAPDGTLWFGTAGLEPSFLGPLFSTEGAGVSRFDASSGEADERWTTYSTADGLAGNTIRSIAVAPDGTLWFGSEYGGVSRFDPTLPNGAAETWTTYTMTASPTGQIWFLQNSITSIAAGPDDALWFATQRGVYRLAAPGEAGGSASDEEWTICSRGEVFEGANAYVIAMAPDGALWFGTDGRGVFRLDPAFPEPCEAGTWTNYTRGSTDEGLVDNQVYAIAVASDGALWFGTGAGVSRFDGSTWTTYTTADGLADYWVYSITVAPDGVLWFGTSGGVSRFDGQTWTRYTTADGLANDNVWAIAVAPDGALWFGTKGGVSRFLPPD